MIRATTSNGPSHCQQSRPLAVVLLYTAGMRGGELASLTLDDDNSVDHVLLIRESKLHKTRIVPLSEDTTDEIERYLQERGRRQFPGSSDAALLLYHHGGFRGYTGTGLIPVPAACALSRHGTQLGRVHSVLLVKSRFESPVGHPERWFESLGAELVWLYRLLVRGYGWPSGLQE